MNIGFFNGEFIDINKAVIPIDERGHQFGDGVYEVVKTYHSVPLLLDEHLERFEKSATAIHIRLPYKKAELKSIIVEGIERAGLENAEVYFQVTRGIAPRNHLFPDVPPSFTLTVKPARKIAERNYESGVQTIIVEDDRWAKCHIKSLNLLPNILAKQNAVNSGNFEAIYEKDGFIAEGTSSNVFVVKNAVLYTTPLTSNILPGITREAILQIAKEEGIESKEERFTKDFLMNADEAFISSTSVEVLPIRTVDGQIIGSGNPGEMTKKLHQLFKGLC
ncbi:D-amino-acid transaminase [Litchfieldia salsa]|uniref:D-alanine aminotransferase n=1 Tax=Litchfieldia salsa TaxID=930152 RepID=A0A1H0WS00_9BACI|nr:D-amino-acid transaminase [Litchfieldia salsa]SDP93494.1 D-alanine transaminase [Litchfieldia salsa]